MLTAKEAFTLTNEVNNLKVEQARPEAMRTLETLMGKIAKSANNGDYSIIYDKVSHYVDSLVVANLRGLGYNVELIKNTYLIHW